MSPPELVVLNRIPGWPTEDSLLEEAEEARQLAKVLELPGVMLQCSAFKGKVVGIGTTTRHEHINGQRSFDNMTMEQVIHTMRNELGDGAAKALQHYVRQLEKGRDANGR